MNNYSDLGSKKFMIGLAVICILFLSVIAKAFDFLHDKENNPEKQETIAVKEINPPVQADEKQDSVSENDTGKTRNNGLNISLGYPKPGMDNLNTAPEEVRVLEELEITEPDTEIEAKPVKADSNDERMLELRFQEAKRYKDMKNYSEALEIYQSLADSNTEGSVRARCYEETAIIYGIQKRYGTALSYAQKAYNTEPTTARETLLARLYYKTGDIDKATTRINNVLQRDFTYDK